MLTFGKSITICCLALLAGCAGHLPQAERIAPSVILDSERMASAQAAFYESGEVDQLEAALESAHAAGPDSAAFHELGFELARLKADSGRAGQHLLAALTDGAATNTLDLLGQVSEVRWSIQDQKRLLRIYLGLAQEHPDPVVRSAAASQIWPMSHLFGLPIDHKLIAKNQGFRPALSILGPFDNDQGKGFEVAYPPESEIDLSKSYPGKLAELSWRRDVPSDRTGLINLGAMMHPSRWQAAYAVTAFNVRDAGPYEIRLGASSGLKVWLNGVEIFSARQLEKYRFDSVVLPVTLAAGNHRILIKSTQARGDWNLGVRVTRSGGASPTVGQLVVADPNLAPTGQFEASKIELEDMVNDRFKSEEPVSRRNYLITRYWKSLGMKAKAIENALQLMAQNEGSLLRTELLAVAYWNNQERGQAADLLNQLQEKVDEKLYQLPFTRRAFGSSKNSGKRHVVCSVNLPRSSQSIWRSTWL